MTAAHMKVLSIAQDAWHIFLYILEETKDIIEDYNDIISLDVVDMKTEIENNRNYYEVLTHLGPYDIVCFYSSTQNYDFWRMLVREIRDGKYEISDNGVSREAILVGIHVPKLERPAFLKRFPGSEEILDAVNYFIDSPEELFEIINSAVPGDARRS